MLLQRAPKHPFSYLLTIIPLLTLIRPCLFPRTGLRLLEESEQHHQLEFEVLRSKIAAGLASGKAKPVDDTFDRLTAKYTNN